MQKFTKEQRNYLEQQILKMLHATVENCFTKDKVEKEKIGKELEDLWCDFYDNCEY